MEGIYIVTGICATVGFSIAIWVFGLTSFGVFMSVGSACIAGFIGFSKANNCVQLY